MEPKSDAWLYRQGELILGPVPAQQINDKLYSGELTPASEVQKLGSPGFRPLSSFAEFKIHLARAAVKQKVEAQEATHQAEEKKKLTTRVGMIAAGLGVLLITLVVLGSYLAIHAPPLSGEDDQITIDAPTISKARRRDNEEFVDYQHAGSGRRQGGSSAPARTDKPAGPTAGASAQSPGGAKPKPGSADPDGMQVGGVDEEGINAVVSKYKPTLISCIKAVAKPGVVAKIPIEFSISDSGRVTKVWVDNPDFKGDALQDCLLKELQKWPFKAGQSGAAVNLSFNIGKH
jgi:hypothetical protein